MSAHTPGPWRWWPCKDGSFKPAGDYVQVAAGKVQVAKIQVVSVTEEDLQLMVAAPDLLAALQAMLTHMGLDEDEWTRPSFDQARAAIAKATGGAA